MYISFFVFLFKFRFTQLGTAPFPSLTYVRFGTGSNNLKLVFFSCWLGEANCLQFVELTNCLGLAC
jgi:hypothetical protein